MSNKKTLEVLERNIDGLGMLQKMAGYGEGLSYEELTLQIEIDRFKGYECLLPVMLLSSQDPVVERVRKRLFLQLFREKLCGTGARATISEVARVMRKEHKN